jgi:hypothetical protein
MAENSLMRLAEIAGDKEMAARRKARIEKSVAAMRKHMWDEESGTFLSVKRDSLEKIPVATIGSWMALMAGVPTEPMARRMAEALQTEHWTTPLPVPTVDRKDPRWKPDSYWRGDVWPAPNYQIATGLASYAHIKRRGEVRGVVRGITVLDDFAHHPTAIAATIAALRSRAPTARLVAILEPRSNTMKIGAVAAQLPASLAGADRVFCFVGGTISWDVDAALAPLGELASVHRDFAAMTEQIVAEARPGDQLVVMSNGGFQGIHARLLARLAAGTSAR